MEFPGDTLGLDKLIYNMNNDLSPFLRKLSVRLIVSSFIHKSFKNINVEAWATDVKCGKIN